MTAIPPDGSSGSASRTLNLAMPAARCLNDGKYDRAIELSQIDPSDQHSGMTCLFVPTQIQKTVNDLCGAIATVTARSIRDGVCLVHNHTLSEGPVKSSPYIPYSLKTDDSPLFAKATYQQ